MRRLIVKRCLLRFSKGSVRENSFPKTRCACECTYGYIGEHSPGRWQSNAIREELLVTAFEEGLLHFKLAARASGAHQRSDSNSDVRLSHQRFADKHCADSFRSKTLDISVTGDAAFADQQDVFGNQLLHSKGMFQ